MGASHGEKDPRHPRQQLTTLLQRLERVGVRTSFSPVQANAVRLGLSLRGRNDFRYRSPPVRAMV